MATNYPNDLDPKNGISPIIDTLGEDDVIHIFIHSLASLGELAELEETLPGFEKYPERSLVIARADDIVCVSRGVDDEYLKFLSALGVGPKKENVIVVLKEPGTNMGGTLSELLLTNHDVLRRIQKLVPDNKRIVLNLYIVVRADRTLVTMLEIILHRNVDLQGGNHDLVQYINSKQNVRMKSLELEVPLAEGDIVELHLHEEGDRLDVTPILAAINRYIVKTGKVIIRGIRGFSGFSTLVVDKNTDSIQEALRKISERTDERVYLVETMFDVIASPNILMQIEPDGGNIFCVSITDQILTNKLVHEGNISPSNTKTIEGMLNSAREISKWLQAEGYRGLAGFDFGEYFSTETGELNYFLAEINPRTNGSAYPKFLMEHLNRIQIKKGRPSIEAFVSARLETKADSFSELRELYGHLFFNSETGKGLVPYNTGCLEIGKFNIAVLGKSRREVVSKYEHFKSLLAEE